VRETVLLEIRKLAKANNGQPPGIRSFEQQTGIRESAWRGVYWARWGDALKEAGFSPNEWQGKSEANLIVQKYIDAARHYGFLPTASELQMYRNARTDFPGVKTVFKYFGSKEGLLSNLRVWVQDKPDPARYREHVRDRSREREKRGAEGRSCLPDQVRGSL
jgi:hypothetical protein